MSIYEEIEKIILTHGAVNYQNRNMLVESLAGLCEREYVKGKEMQKQLLRIKLGLAVDSDR